MIVYYTVTNVLFPTLFSIQDSSDPMGIPSCLVLLCHIHKCHEVLKQPEACKVIIKMHMVVLVLEITGKGLHYMCTKAFFTLFLSPSVHVEGD